MTMRKHDVLRELIVFLAVTSFIIAALYVSCGCKPALVNTGSDTSTEVEVEPEVITENVDESYKNFQDIVARQFTAIETRVSTNKSDIETNTSTVNNGIKFGELVLAGIVLVVLYFVYEYLKYNVYRKKKKE